MKKRLLFRVILFFVLYVGLSKVGNTQVVISQVYGGGGNTGATYINDFIELFNRGTTAVDLTGWSVQQTSATGTSFGNKTDLPSFTLAPGQYFLIQEAAGAGGTTPLPTPDAIGIIALGGTSGKVALVNSTIAITVSCPTGANIMDFVGYGTSANCFEGTGPTPAPSNTTSVSRVSNGCTDINNNALDFTAGIVNPRNSASPLNVCATASPTINVNSPSAGAQWKQGSSYPINWSGSNINANVKIEFSSNASSGTPTWTTLNASIAASAGTWTWSVPAAQALSADCKIRITDIPLTATGLSGTFSIVPPPTPVSTLAALRAGTVGTTYIYTGQGVLTFKQTFRNQKYIQDATAAILIDDPTGKFTTSYNVGDAITNIIGTVAEFDNMMQLTPESNPGPPASTGNTIAPQVATLQQITANWESYESELVRVNNVTFTGATGNFANGIIYPIADAGANTGNFRTTFYDVDYIATAIPQGSVDLIVIPNSRIDGNHITSRSLSDIMVLLPSITVTSPNGGQFYQQGTTHTITWTSNNFTGNVKIELTGNNPSVIAASVANTGSYIWNISPTQTIATDYKVKISDAADGDPSDLSNNTFAIVAPYTLPNLVITEIMYNSTGNDEEWIEIYNNSSSSVDMAGYFIVDDDPAHMNNPIVLPAGAVIAAGHYYTVENATAGAFPFVPDFDGSSKSISLGNTTDQVKLYHKFGQLIDSVKYMDSSPWPTAPDGTGPSLTFCDPSQDNSVATYWSASTEPFLTLQGTTIKATPGSGCYVSSDNVMITEIMYNPIDGGNDTIEFIEIYNKGNAGVNLKDWYFAQGVTYVFPDVTLAPGAYYLVARNADAMYYTFGITVPQWTGFLDDAGEPIVLKDAIGFTKDSVFYLPTAPWPTAASNGGPSLTFCNTALDNSIAENWSASANQVAVNGLGQPIYASPGTGCASGAHIVISEIMYNPPETGTDSLEFIELYNAGNTINMQGFAFSAGVDFVFPSFAFPANEYLLVAGNAVAIQNTFGKTALQWTSGGLNNTGEAITLRDNYGAIIDEVTYADVAPWDPLADGFGPSLTLCDVTSDNSLPINWKASSEFVTVNAAGDSIFATPLGGCVNPPTVANFVAAPTSIIEGESVQFTDLSTNSPTAWEWTFTGGTPATSTDQNPSVQYLLPGNYSVTLKATNLYGNSTVTKADYITVGVDGIVVNKSSFSVYPNPTSGKVTITNTSGREQEIAIYSMLGKQLSSFLSSSLSFEVDLTGMPAGIYMVQLVDTHSKQVQHIKVILN